MPINKLNEPLEWCLGQHHGPHGSPAAETGSSNCFVTPLCGYINFRHKKTRKLRFGPGLGSVSYNFVSMQMYALHSVLHWPDFACLCSDAEKSTTIGRPIESVSWVRSWKSGRDRENGVDRRSEDPDQPRWRSPNNALLTLMENLRVTNIKNAIVRKQDEPLRMTDPIWSRTVRSNLIRLRGGVAVNCPPSLVIDLMTDMLMPDCLEPRLAK